MCRLVMGLSYDRPNVVTPPATLNTEAVVRNHGPRRLLSEEGAQVRFLVWASKLHYDGARPAGEARQVTLRGSPSTTNSSTTPTITARMAPVSIPRI